MGRKAAALDGEAWFGAPIRALVPLDEISAEEEIAALSEVAREAGLKRLAALLSTPGPLRDFRKCPETALA